MSRILIVGAGMCGSVIARELAEAGHDIQMIDKRNHIAGNCYDYIDLHGITIHKYGPHIFHTNNKKVVDWLSRFTEWNEYQHKVKAILSDGRYVTLPVNKETTEIVGQENILDTFFRPYTKKMWGKELEELNPDIINRVPVRTDMNDLYFPNDQFQFMPKEGYTKMFERMLDHPNIKVQLNTEFHKEFEAGYDHIFNSMPIDQYFDFVYGELPYRSIKFHTVSLPSPRMQPVPCVNFTHDGPYTRMTEWKCFPGHGKNDTMTTLTYEEPCDYRENNMERYYPVKDIDGHNIETYKKYKALKQDNVTFIGRTGMYIYIDMDQACSSALGIARKFLVHV